MSKARRYIEDYLERSRSVANALKDQNDAIEGIIEALFSAWEHRKPVFIIGNGGSASTATHFVADLVKTVVENPGDQGIKAYGLADNIPLASALVNDWGWDKVYDSQLATYWEPGSIVIALSVNGGMGSDKAGVYSQNLLRALQFAKKNEGATIGIVGDKYAGGAFKNICDLCVIVPDGSTPQVESFHVVLTHLITFRLKKMIAEYKESGQ